MLFAAYLFFSAVTLSQWFLIGEIASALEIDCQDKCDSPRDADAILALWRRYGIEVRAVSGANLQDIWRHVSLLPDEASVILAGGWNARQRGHWVQRSEKEWRWIYDESWVEYLCRLEAEWRAIESLASKKNLRIKRINVGDHSSECEAIEEKGSQRLGAFWSDLVSYYSTMKPLRQDDPHHRCWTETKIAKLIVELEK